jgi:hypothetical protein
MYNYDTVVEAINGLKKRGFIIDFNLAFKQSICEESSDCLAPSDYFIIETYRFEGDSNPSDEDIVYAIESKDGKIKGIFTGAFGMYYDSTDLSKLQNHL